MATTTTTEQGKTAPGKPSGSVELAHSQSAVDRAAERARLAAEGGPDPYPPYDLMSLEELREVADELDVAIPPDVEKSLLITELRANRSGTLSVARRRNP